MSRTPGDWFLTIVYRVALPFCTAISAFFAIGGLFLGEYFVGTLATVVTICNIHIMKSNWNVGSEKYNELLKIPPKAKVVK